MIRARGFSPSSLACLLGHDDHRGGPVVQRARVAGRDLPARLEDGIQRGERLERGAPARPVVGIGAVPGRDLAREEARVLSGDGALLRALREAVHVLARDVPSLGDVLGGQAHRDVDVGDRRVVAEQLRMQLLGVLRVAVDLGDRLDAGSDEGVPLAGLDRVKGHPDRLQRGGAEAVDRRARDGVGQIGEQSCAAAEVHALPLLGEAAADHDVVDLTAVELGHLLQRGVDREADEVVGPRVHERPLLGAPDRRAGGGNDHCFRQRRSLL